MSHSTSNTNTKRENRLSLLKSEWVTWVLRLTDLRIIAGNDTNEGCYNSGKLWSSFRMPNP
uniref:Uncharacterized protein n=1 Tax=Anguilla anguilla TaxID=7936 RepID=A0A0E9P887_ANGAN